MMQDIRLPDAPDQPDLPRRISCIRMYYGLLSCDTIKLYITPSMGHYLPLICILLPIVRSTPAGADGMSRDSRI